MSSVLNPRTCVHRALCLVLAMLTAATPAMVAAQAPDQPAPQAAAPADLSYVAPTACAIIAVRPAQVLNSPMAEMYPIEVLQAVMLQQIGLDPLTADQVVASVTPPTVGPPSYTLNAKFSKPPQLKLDRLGYPVEQVLRGGKKLVHAVGDMMAPSILFPSESSIVLVNEFGLEAALGERPAQASGLAAQFAAATQGDDLLALIDLEHLRPLISMGLTQAPIPPELAELRNAHNLMKLVQLRLNLSRPGVSELVVTANNQADADRLVASVDLVKKFFASQADAQIQRLQASLDPVEQANGRYLKRMIGYWDRQLQVTREDGGRLVLFRVDSSKTHGTQFAQVAVIGVLVALLLPAIQAAREAARRNASMNNVKQILLGLLNYESARGQLPASANFDAAGKPLLSWRVHILPFVEQQQLYAQFHLDEPWDSPHNQTLIPLMPALYLDPSSAHAAAEGLTHYLGVKGDGRLFDGTPQGRRFADLRDGTANTLAVVQVDDDRTVAWTRPDDWEMDETNPMAGLGGMHSGNIFLGGFCDGHIVAISAGIDPMVLKAFLTIAGGESPQGF